jgi:methylglutaconyl-CoA hydratase
MEAVSHMSALAIERQGPIGLITLNRPERHNAFDDVLIAELSAALRSMEDDEGVRVVVLSGAGKSFSAGADLNWMKRMAGFSKQENERDAAAMAALMQTLAHLRKPTVARVHGAAYGGGVGLVACCDIAVAAQAATFSLSEAKLGLVPAVISPYVVSAIGERAARRYFLTAERFDAAEAWRLGLVHELGVDDADMDGKIGDIVESILACGPMAQREAKELIRAVAGRPVTSELIEDTAERIARLRSSPEGREGVAAFLEKRRAAWVPPEPEAEPLESEKAPPGI